MSVDLENYAFSFSHAIIRLAETQYTAIENVSFSQDVDRSAQYGTARSPLRKSAGQLQLGEGTVMFSDLEAAMSFIEALGDEPTLALFSIDVTFTNGDATRTFELQGCSLSGVSGDFEQGADAMGLEIPFDFLRMTVNAVALASN